MSELIAPTPTDVRKAIEESKCDIVPWVDHFALGTVAENLRHKGFNPIGVCAILTPDAAKYSGTHIGETGKMPPGIYSIVENQTYAPIGDKLVPFIRVESEKGEQYTIQGDVWIFTDDVEKIV